MSMLTDALADRTVRKAAQVSGDELHRWWLLRRVGAGARVLVWCMLNPSKANGISDDPTIRRVMAFTHGFGYDIALVVNVFSWRATDPRACLANLADAAPQENVRVILAAAADRDVVCAWGAHEWAREQAEPVIAALRFVRARLFHLGLSKHGMPRHPLMLRKDAVMTPWNGGF